MRPKIHPKILKIAPKEIQNPSKRVKNRFKTHFGRQEVKHFYAMFKILFRFFEAPEPPKTRPKFQKMKKNRSKIIIEKKIFSKTFFNAFLRGWPSQNETKIMFFSHFLENVDFAKIVLPSRRN